MSLLQESVSAIWQNRCVDRHTINFMTFLNASGAESFRSLDPAFIAMVSPGLQALFPLHLSEDNTEGFNGKVYTKDFAAIVQNATGER